MTSSGHGKDILTNDCVTNITNIGFWILINQIEYFIPFDEYPLFRKATIEQISKFRVLSPNQVNWENLDIDIELKALKEPYNYPLQFSEDKSK